MLVKLYNNNVKRVSKHILFVLLLLSTTTIGYTDYFMLMVCYISFGQLDTSLLLLNRNNTLRVYAINQILFMVLFGFSCFTLQIFLFYFPTPPLLCSTFFILYILYILLSYKVLQVIHLKKCKRYISSSLLILLFLLQAFGIPLFLGKVTYKVPFSTVLEYVDGDWMATNPLWLLIDKTKRLVDYSIFIDIKYKQLIGIDNDKNITIGFSSTSSNCARVEIYKHDAAIGNLYINTKYIPNTKVNCLSECGHYFALHDGIRTIYLDKYIDSGADYFVGWHSGGCAIYVTHYHNDKKVFTVSEVCPSDGEINLISPGITGFNKNTLALSPNRQCLAFCYGNTVIIKETNNIGKDKIANLPLGITYPHKMRWINNSLLIIVDRQYVLYSYNIKNGRFYRLSQNWEIVFDFECLHDGTLIWISDGPYYSGIMAKKLKLIEGNLTRWPRRINAPNMGKFGKRENCERHLLTRHTTLLLPLPLLQPRHGPMDHPANRLHRQTLARLSQVQAK